VCIIFGKLLQKKKLLKKVGKLDTFIYSRFPHSISMGIVLMCRDTHLCKCAGTLICTNVRDAHLCQCAYSELIGLKVRAHPPHVCVRSDTKRYLRDLKTTNRQNLPKSSKMIILWEPVIGGAVGVTYRRGCGSERVKSVSIFINIESLSYLKYDST
jgi:hypothetical protein